MAANKQTITFLLKHIKINLNDCKVNPMSLTTQNGLLILNILVQSRNIANKVSTLVEKYICAGGYFTLSRRGCQTCDTVKVKNFPIAYLVNYQMALKEKICFYTMNPFIIE